MDRLCARIIEGLMCNGQIDLDAVARAHGIDLDLLQTRAAKALGEVDDLGRLERGVLPSPPTPPPASSPPIST